MDQSSKDLQQQINRIKQGGKQKYHDQLKTQNKLFVRERLTRLFDPDSITEDYLFAEANNPDLPADALVTGMGKINGRVVAFAAGDASVKAGSWGAKTIEKFLRIQETAMSLKIPLLYLVDSAGARITDQIDVFPGRRHAGRIFYNQVQYSGVAPQIAILFGPSPAGAAYMPAFCDLVIMVDGNASAYLGSPRMAEMVIGEKVTLEEMGGARMHCSVSGLGDFLAKDESEAIELTKCCLNYLPQNYQSTLTPAPGKPPALQQSLKEIIPDNTNRAFDMKQLIQALVDGDSFLEVKAEFAKELIVGFARLNGRQIGLIANQPKVKAGTLFADSSDKAARFIHLCNAYGLPLLFLSDVPGFMIGSQVERSGIIRHGAKLVAAVAQATVPKISIIVRKCYGAGLYAMCGPAFGTDITLALPSAQIAVMGPEAAVNAVYANHIENLSEEEKATFIAEKREAYRQDIDLYRLASQMIIDGIVDFDALRDELIQRYELYENKKERFSERINPIYPV